MLRALLVISALVLGTYAQAAQAPRSAEPAPALALPLIEIGALAGLQKPSRAGKNGDASLGIGLQADYHFRYWAPVAAGLFVITGSRDLNSIITERYTFYGFQTS